MPPLPSDGLVDVEAAIADYVAQWASGSAPVGSACSIDETMLAEQLRPSVFEKVRGELDPVMRDDLVRLKV